MYQSDDDFIVVSRDRAELLVAAILDAAGIIEPTVQQEPPRPKDTASTAERQRCYRERKRNGSNADRNVTRNSDRNALRDDRNAELFAEDNDAS